MPDNNDTAPESTLNQPNNFQDAVIGTVVEGGSITSGIIGLALASNGSIAPPTRPSDAQNTSSNILFTAIQNNNFRLVTTILNQDPSIINMENILGRTPLILAVTKKHDEIANELARRGANLESFYFEKYHDCPSIYPEQWNALAYAAYKGYTETVKNLMYAGAKPIQDPNGINNIDAFERAERSGHRLVIDILNRTPLMNAVYDGNMPAIDYLLQKENTAGSDIPAYINTTKYGKDSGKTAITYVGHRSVLEKLLLEGAAIPPDFLETAKLMQKDYKGKASIEERIDTLHLLMDRGVIPLKERRIIGGFSSDYDPRMIQAMLEHTPSHHTQPPIGYAPPDPLQGSGSWTQRATSDGPGITRR